MKASRVASVIKSFGINVLDFSEGDDLVDGAVYISETVHVQVPTFGNEVGVIKDQGGSLLFYQAHKMKDIDSLINDIN